MASKQISPAAQLLRHSKLFSLPAALPNIANDTNGVIARYESDSATQSYPTKAAIITTDRGRARGDWGLKRNLPLKKTTRRANPILQVKSIDNIDHFTDYQSGRSHAIALRKFQEMNIPINHRPYDKAKSDLRTMGLHRSVFDVYEPTAPRSSSTEAALKPVDAGLSAALLESGNKTKRDLERWTFEGPWLAGMDEIQFQNYLEGRVKPQREQFKAYLKSWMLRVKKGKSQSDKLAAGKIATQDKHVQLSEKEYETWLAELRHEGKQLYTLMWSFLDLPGRAPSEQNDQSIGPPTTHPSAGLSYLKTDSTMQNHPMVGPLLEHQPVPARMLQKSTVSVGIQRDKGPAVGIAGFVSSDAVRRDLFATKTKRHSEAQGGDDMRGEKKIYVVPHGATIDEKGRTNIQWNEADSDSVALWEAEYNAQEHAKSEEETKKIDRLMQNSPQLGLPSSLRGRNR